MTSTDPTTFLERLRPAGSKRSSKRDLIVNVFLRQEGHLTADDLVDLIRREDERISRATATSSMSASISELRTSKDRLQVLQMR